MPTTSKSLSNGRAGQSESELSDSDLDTSIPIHSSCPSKLAPARAAATKQGKQASSADAAGANKRGTAVAPSRHSIVPPSTSHAEDENDDDDEEYGFAASLGYESDGGLAAQLQMVMKTIVRARHLVTYMFCHPVTPTMVPDAPVRAPLDAGDDQAEA